MTEKASFECSKKVVPFRIVIENNVIKNKFSISLQVCGFPRKDSDDNSKPETEDDKKITETGVLWALEQQGTVLEKSKTELAHKKDFATHRLLQSIHSLDYQCMNNTLKQKDSSGEHTGNYHPMDLMHFLIKNFDVPSLDKLYQKLSVCKLAVPVLFQNRGECLQGCILRDVKTGQINAEHKVEGNVTNAPVAILSMIRCGQKASNLMQN